MHSDPDHTPEPGEPPGIALHGRVLSAPTLIASAAVVVVVGLAVYRVFDIDWRQMWRQVSSADASLYAVAVLSHYATYWLRGLRWRLIAQTARLDETEGVRLPSTLSASAMILMAGFANSAAFMRAGDAYRGWAFAKESGATLPASLGTVLAERVQDMAVVLALLVTGAAIVVATGEVGLPAAALAAGAVMTAVSILLVVGMRALGLRLPSAVPGPARAWYARFRAGTLMSFRARSLPPQVALGAAAWLLEAGRLYAVGQSLGIELAFPVALVAALAGSMLTTIPTPGGFGFVEGGLTGMFIMMGFGGTDAFTLVVVDRTINWLSVIVIGGGLFLVWQMVKASPVGARIGGSG